MPTGLDTACADRLHYPAVCLGWKAGLVEAGMLWRFGNENTVKVVAHCIFIVQLNTFNSHIPTELQIAIFQSQTAILRLQTAATV